MIQLFSDNTSQLPKLNQIEGWSQINYNECVERDIQQERWTIILPAVPSSEELQLKKLLTKYWGCDDSVIESNLCMPKLKLAPMQSGSVKRSKKKLLLQKIDFERQLSKLQADLAMIPTSSSEIITSRTKSIRSDDFSIRRSQYIGVSRNGPSWQALIAIKKRKTYIGTYDDQDEAARAFDFYSMLLHSLTAKTNFSYTKREVLDMIDRYSDPRNNNKF